MATANPQTKAIKALAKKSQKNLNSRLNLYVERNWSAPSYQRDQAFFELTLSTEARDSKASVRESVAQIAGHIRNGSTSKTETYKYDGKDLVKYADAYEPTSGYWSLYAVDTFANVVELLPNDAEIKLSVGLDSGTNDLSVKAGIHVDYLYLHATWKRNGKDVVRRYLIDSATGHHNTARFGNPNFEFDQKGRAA